MRRRRGASRAGRSLVAAGRQRLRERHRLRGARSRRGASLVRRRRDVAGAARAAGRHRRGRRAAAGRDGLRGRQHLRRGRPAPSAATPAGRPLRGAGPDAERRRPVPACTGSRAARGARSSPPTSTWWTSIRAIRPSWSRAAAAAPSTARPTAARRSRRSAAASTRRSRAGVRSGTGRGAALDSTDDGGVISSDDGAATWRRVPAAPKPRVARAASGRSAEPRHRHRTPGGATTTCSRGGWSSPRTSAAPGASCGARARSASAASRSHRAHPRASTRRRRGRRAAERRRRRRRGARTGSRSTATGRRSHWRPRRLALRPTLGGRRPATVHVPLVAPGPDEHTLGAVVRIAFRYDGRVQTAGLGDGLFGARTRRSRCPDPRRGSRHPAEGSVEARSSASAASTTPARSACDGST